MAELPTVQHDEAVDLMMKFMDQKISEIFLFLFFRTLFWSLI